MAKKVNKDIPLEIVEVFRSGPKVPRLKDGNKDWEFLIYELKKLGVTPGEAYRIIAEKKGNTNIRFQWKMMRFTMYVWQRHKEGKNSMILRPKNLYIPSYFDNLHYWSIELLWDLFLGENNI